MHGKGSFLPTLLYFSVAIPPQKLEGGLVFVTQWNLVVARQAVPPFALALGKGSEKSRAFYRLGTIDQNFATDPLHHALARVVTAANAFHGQG